MAKDLNTSNLSIVESDGSLRVISGERTIEVGAVYLDGERLEGVYAELEAGALPTADGENAVAVPAGVQQRDAFLKKWSDAAKKASRAKKAGGASLLLLSLAACGGGGGSGTTVVAPKEASLSNDGATVDISSSTAGAIVNVADSADNEFSQVLINGAGSSGTLVLDFVDANDTVQVVAASEISGFTVIEVRHGTVDFTALGLGVLSNDTLSLGSGAIITYAQYIELGAVQLRDGATSGELSIIMSVAEKRALDTSKIEAGINLSYDIVDTAQNLLDPANAAIVSGAAAVSVTGGEAGNLSIADYNTLTGLTSDDSFGYSIVDTAANLLANGDAAPLTGADAVSVTGGAAGNLSIADYNTLTGLTSDDSFGYSIVDETANIFDANGAFLTGVSSTLSGASNVVITDSNTLTPAELTTLNAFAAANAGVNLPPIVQENISSLSRSFVEDSASGEVTLNGSIKFADANIGDIYDSSKVSFAPVDGALGDFALTLVNNPGTASGRSVAWQYVLNNSATQYLAEGEVKTETYNVTFNDQNGGTATT